MKTLFFALALAQIVPVWAPVYFPSEDGPEHLYNAWVMREFEPMAAIPSTVKLTQYSSDTVSAANSTQALQQIVDGVEAGRYRVSIDRVFHFNEIVEAHRYMEENRAKGKLVVVVD